MNSLQKIASGLGTMKRTVGQKINTGSMIDEDNSPLNAISKGLKKANADKKAKRLMQEAEYQKQQEALEKEQALQEQEIEDAFN